MEASPDSPSDDEEVSSSPSKIQGAHTGTDIIFFNKKRKNEGVTQCREKMDVIRRPEHPSPSWHACVNIFKKNPNMSDPHHSQVFQVFLSV
jgi:hypothetical protein